MKTIYVKNVPDEQHQWLREEAAKYGTSMSGIIKMIVRQLMDKEKK